MKPERPAWQEGKWERFARESDGPGDLQITFICCSIVETDPESQMALAKPGPREDALPKPAFSGKSSSGCNPPEMAITMEPLI